MSHLGLRERKVACQTLWSPYTRRPKRATLQWEKWCWVYGRYAVIRKGILENYALEELCRVQVATIQDSWFSPEVNIGWNCNIQGCFAWNLDTYRCSVENSRKSYSSWIWSYKYILFQGKHISCNWAAQCIARSNCRPEAAQADEICGKAGRLSSSCVQYSAIVDWIEWYTNL